MKKLLIFPFNGNGLEALDCLGQEFELIGFVDDTLSKQGRSSFGFEVYSREAFKKYPEALVLSVPGSSQSYLEREKLISGLDLPKERWATVIHPMASVSKLAKIGRNVLIMAGTVITSKATIGDHVLILPNTVIHHDVTVAELTIIGSGVQIAGHVKIGRNAYIGSGSSIINNIEIGHGALVGLGSNVIKSVAPHARVAGNPARPIDKKEAPGK
jgi:sugar O-acyltransferase (sialic acid O-acetyltransferase NeuD family)